jgi:hypothetical protein
MTIANIAKIANIANIRRFAVPRSAIFGNSMLAILAMLAMLAMSDVHEDPCRD